jgi:hypothetical protein
MALTQKLKFLPALKIAELAKASPCIRLGAGAFLCYVAPKFLRQKLPADIIFLYRTYKKG